VSFAVHHHWVPRSYLRRWSGDGRSVSAYRLLVSHHRVPLWSHRSIERAAARAHLYTTISNAREPDIVERWLNEEVEQPALDAIERLVSGRRLDDVQWSRLVRFAMALHVRAPANYIETTERFSKEVPSILDATLKRLPRALERASRGKGTTSRSAPDVLVRLPVRVSTAPAAEQGLVEVRAVFSAGREAWLHQLTHVLTVTAAKVAALGQQWSLARPFRDAEWFTTDNPVLRLNYYGEGRSLEYDLRGGWGNKGTEIMLPLSQTHLLYAKIGDRMAEEFTFGREHTLLVQRFLAENALREIYARLPHRRAVMFRPRLVSAEQFASEEEEWRKFHVAQTASVVSSPTDQDG
jgi:hypothetical protein